MPATGGRLGIWGVVPLLALLTALLLAACSAAPGPVRRVNGIAYCHLGGTAETLDLYLPASPPRHPHPLVIYIHGGAWQSGSADFSPDSLFGSVESSLVAQGWAFASINYRLAPRYRWPAQIQDATCAVRYLRAHAGTFHIDPAQIGVLGDSAGGQLVALLGLAPPSAGFNVGPALDISSSVQAVADLYGPTNLNSPKWRRSLIGREVSPAVFGIPAGQPSPVLVAASPVTYVAPGAPPFLVVQGQEDRLVPPVQSKDLVARLRSSGDLATLVPVRNAGHTLAPANGRSPAPSVAAVALTIEAFFKAHLSSAVTK